MSRHAFLLVGVGPHATRFYLPALARMAREGRCTLAGAVELEGKGPGTMAALAGAAFAGAEVILVPGFEGEMPPAARALLDRMAEKARLDAVIVATEPLCHLPYVEWALGRGLHVLLDKPVTARRDAVNSPDQALGIELDFRRMVRALDRAPGNPFVSVCAHRRYHPGFDLVLAAVRDACARTGCPVTAIHAHHADGQWRLPMEILTQDHHSYHAGHGKASHSGHHFFDSVHRYMAAGRASGKVPDSMRIHAAAVRPAGLLRQLGGGDLERLFGPGYRKACPLSDSELLRRFRACGEVDLSATIEFLMEGEAAALASLDLLHNSFSRRSWLEPAADLYKGNGRVKHEHHRVHVGPFLACHVDSYQAKSEHASSDGSDLAPGGNNHFDITLFRNVDFLGGREVERIRLADIGSFDAGSLFIEQVKEGVVGEFMDFLDGRIPREAMRSPLPDHAVPTAILGACYESITRAAGGDNPVVSRGLG